MNISLAFINLDKPSLLPLSAEYVFANAAAKYSHFLSRTVCQSFPSYNFAVVYSSATFKRRAVSTSVQLKTFSTMFTLESSLWIFWRVFPCNLLLIVFIPRFLHRLVNLRSTRRLHSFTCEWNRSRGNGSPIRTEVSYPYATVPNGPMENTAMGM